MAELTVKQITEYLKQISELETSVYKQTEVRKKAKNDLKMPEVKKKDIKRPQLVALNKPSPLPSRMEHFFSEGGGPEQFAFWFGAIGAVIGIIYFFSILSDYDFEYLWGIPVTFFIGGLLIMGIGLLMRSVEYQGIRNKYFAELKIYETNSAQNRTKYDSDMRVYEANEKIAREQYNEAFKKAKTAYNTASVEVAKLDKPLEETQAILNKLYDADIIFPKYRNMVAMCTIYEYFASGRCTELTGATGAYNLYESELRQNLIINQLEEVNANLEQVRQNQYILYQGISETNKALNEVSGDIKGILSMTADIAVSSRINAFCSQITAANVKALTYMETYEYITQ